MGKREYCFDFVERENGSVFPHKTAYSYVSHIWYIETHIILSVNVGFFCLTKTYV